jgi:hypothetical protein
VRSSRRGRQSPVRSRQLPIILERVVRFRLDQKASKHVTVGAGRAVRSGGRGVALPVGGSEGGVRSCLSGGHEVCRADGSAWRCLSGGGGGRGMSRAPLAGTRARVRGQSGRLARAAPGTRRALASHLCDLMM